MIGWMILLSPFLAYEASAAETVYYAQKNDTIGHLSEKLLKSFRRWPELAAYNKLKPPYFIREGRMIRYEGLRMPPVGSPSSAPIASPSSAPIASPLQSPNKSPPPPVQTVIPVRSAPALVFEKDPLLFEKAQSLVKAEKYSEALPLLDVLYAEKPDQFSIGFLQIRCYLALNDITRAREVGENLLRTHPEFQNLPLFQNQLKLTLEPRGSDSAGVPGGAN